MEPVPPPVGRECSPAELRARRHDAINKPAPVVSSKCSRASVQADVLAPLKERLDSIWQMTVMTYDFVWLKVLHGNVRVAEIDRHHRHLGCPGRGDVGWAIADHHGPAG